jgi:hypothetical protein
MTARIGCNSKCLDESGKQSGAGQGTRLVDIQFLYSLPAISETYMFRNTLTLGAVIVAATSLVVGCSDSVVDPSGASASKVTEYDAAFVAETALVDFSELPTLDEALHSAVVDSSNCDTMPGRRGHGHPGHGGRGPGGDSLGDGGDSHRGPRGWHMRGGGRDFGPIGFRDYKHISKALGLSAEQDSLLKTYLADLRNCAKDAAAPYKEARKAAFESMKSQVEDVREAVEAGTMTEADAKAAVDAIRAEYRATIDPLNEQVRAAVDECRATFTTAFEAILTAEQLELWQTLKG